LFHSWLATGITSVIIFFTLFHVLKPVLPLEGRVLFSFAVILFLSIVIYLSGYAQYLCPACGRQPTIEHKPRVWHYNAGSPFDEVRLKLVLNPIECPHCHVRLRAG
jgi:predicted membrane channel-forming protein YqfA (hemolysin III family)